MISELKTASESGISRWIPVPVAMCRTRYLTNHILIIIGMLIVSLLQPVHAEGDSGTTFRRVRTQFIAALGEPGASSGINAQSWGLWRVDPGPRGVRLDRFERLQAAAGVAPAKWQFDSSDWWLEEHGLIMEQPDFPLPAGKYIVTGGREVTSVLTIQPMETDGTQRWQLENGATLYDVTHLACRSARYTPITVENTCTPASAQMTDFPVTAGAEMPPVAGCNKQDYAVLFVIGVEAGN